jgi:hypothetical protein
MDCGRENASGFAAMTKLAFLVVTAGLSVAGCDTHMHKVQKDNGTSQSQVTSPPQSAGQPLATTTDGSQTNIANQANASPPTTKK